MMRRLLAAGSLAVALGSGAPIAVAPLGRVDGEAVSFAGTVFPLRCAFKVAYGTSCGTCGMTRAWIALAHGQLAQACAHHAEALPTFMATAAVALAAGALTWSLWRSPTRARAAALGFAVAAIAWAVAWQPVVARNRALHREVAARVARGETVDAAGEPGRR